MPVDARLPPQKLDGNSYPIPAVFNFGDRQVLSATAVVANSDIVAETTRLVRVATTHDIHFQAGLAPVAATGRIAFAAQPAANDTIALDGITFTFKASGAAGNEINLGADLDETLANAVTVLNASAEPDVSVATYDLDAYDSDVGYGYLLIAHDTAGAAGNAFTLAATGDDITAETATLEDGDDGDSVATTSDSILPAGKVEYLAMHEGWRLSVLRVSADGKVSMTELR